MTLIKDDITKASQQIGLTDDQADNLWKALQEIQTNKPKARLSASLLYVGAIIAFLSMTWFYLDNLENRDALPISIAYAIIFFCTGFYFWYAKKLKIPGGVLSSLGIVMVPLIVYALQNVMHWRPISNDYTGFYRWIHGEWVSMEICTLVVGSVVLYFIRFPLIAALLYLTLAFISMDVIHLFTDPESDQWLYYSISAVTMGSLLNVLAFSLYRKNQKDFGFWTYLIGMSLCWIGISGWNIQTEWGHFIYFLINFLFILLSGFFHRKIFMVFGSLGVIVYISHLVCIFLDSPMFSYILGAIGFSIILFATFLMRSRTTAKLNKLFPFLFLK